MRSKILVITSLALLVATGYMVTTYGQQVYFVAFHKPFHVPFTDSPKKYVAVVLPKFQVYPSISSRSLQPGNEQHMTVTLSTNKTVPGHLEVWIESPAHKQIFRNSSDGAPTQFVEGKSQAFTYTYTLPANSTPGTYQVSAIITSPNSQTDYYVKIDFATFTVS